MRHHCGCFLEPSVVLTPSLFAIASTLGESSNLSDQQQAVEIYESLVKKTLNRSKNYVKAAEHYKEVILLEPNHKGALFNLALLYRNQLGKPNDASSLALHLIQVHPSHMKSYLLLGDIELTEKANTKQAKQYFEQALKLNPTNIQAKHNFCVALADEGELEQSESCLLEAIAMTPKPQNYLLQHLEIIRERLRSRGRRSLSSSTDDD
ncbi:unnamed protein product [Heterobilharzia americana]|nr:unnamed protein product [Heterobilharzia americana]